MIFARTNLSLDPAWPAFLPGLGAGTLAVAAALLVGLTVWTYLGARGASWRRFLLVLTLRLLALVVTVLLILRPSLAVEEEETLQPSRLLLLVDVSRSMDVRDEFNNSSRLQNAHRLLASGGKVEAALRRLAAEKKIETILYQGAAELGRYDGKTPAEGKATDMARWLEGILREQGRDTEVQGLLILSDGVDTGDAARTLQRAGDFRGRFPIHTFALGQSNAGAQEKDIALERIFVDPDPMLAKGKFTVKVGARAAGFENARTDVSLWIEDPATKKMTKVKSLSHKFTQASEQEIVLEADAPDHEGEIKVVVKADPLPGEASVANNEIATYAQVSKEGVRILWVEGKRRWEFAIPIRETLRKDRRFQVVEDLRPLAENAAPRSDNPNALGNKAYDVLVIGDISAKRFEAGDPGVLQKVRDLVEKQGLGVLFLGGYEAFGAGGWNRREVLSIAPVDMSPRDPLEVPVRMKPTADGLQYVLKLADDPKQNLELWDKVFDPLDGISPPGKVIPGATVLATAQGAADLPLLTTITRGKGRVMAFAGDTTWKVWRRTPEAQAAFDRFWKQMMLWLAGQENSQGNVYVRLDSRRLDRGRNPVLAYEVGYRGLEVKEPTFTAKVIGPRKEEYPLTVSAERRGSWTAPAAGEYVLVVHGKAKTTSGATLEGSAQARFLVTEEDREMLRVAADHDFLEKLAAAGGGRFARAEERTLLQRLDEIQANRAAAPSRVVHWPDWRRAPTGDSAREQFTALWQSSALVCLTVYVLALCAEWFLRRRWGMV